jgi:hypothetical protein
MKSLVLLVSLFLASSSYAQITTTVTPHRFALKLRGVGAAPSQKQVVPLGGKLAFAINIPGKTIEFSPDFGDHTITGTIDNLTDSAIGLNFHRFQRLPYGWQSSVCFGALCLSPSSDSGRKPFGFKAHESQAFILHFVDTTTPDMNGQLPVSQKDSAKVTLVVFQHGAPVTDTIMLDLKAIIEANAAVGAAPIVAKDASIVAVYPNPVGSTALSAQIYLPSASKVSVAVYDILGNLVRSSTSMELLAGLNVVRLDPAGLASGSYQLVCSTSGGNQFLKSFEIAR